MRQLISILFACIFLALTLQEIDAGYFGMDWRGTNGFGSSGEAPHENSPLLYPHHRSFHHSPGHHHWPRHHGHHWPEHFHWPRHRLSQRHHWHRHNFNPEHHFQSRHHQRHGHHHWQHNSPELGGDNSELPVGDGDCYKHRPTIPRYLGFRPYFDPFTPITIETVDAASSDFGESFKSTTPKYPGFRVLVDPFRWRTTKKTTLLDIVPPTTTEKQSIFNNFLSTTTETTDEGYQHSLKTDEISGDHEEPSKSETNPTTTDTLHIFNEFDIVQSIIPQFPETTPSQDPDYESSPGTDEEFKISNFNIEALSQ